MAESKDIAGLVIDVDATGVDKGTTSLDRIVAAAAKADTAVSKLGATSITSAAQTKQLAAATDAVGKAVDSETTGAGKLAEALARDATAANTAAGAKRNLAAAIADVSRAQAREAAAQDTFRVVQSGRNSFGVIRRSADTGVEGQPIGPFATRRGAEQEAELQRVTLATEAQSATKRAETLVEQANTAAIERNVAAIATQVTAERAAAADSFAVVKRGRRDFGVSQGGGEPTGSFGTRAEAEEEAQLQRSILATEALTTAKAKVTAGPVTKVTDEAAEQAQLQRFLAAVEAKVAARQAEKLAEQAATTSSAESLAATRADTVAEQANAAAVEKNVGAVVAQSIAEDKIMARSQDLYGQRARLRAEADTNSRALRDAVSRTSVPDAQAAATAAATVKARYEAALADASSRNRERYDDAIAKGGIPTPAYISSGGRPPGFGTSVKPTASQAAEAARLEATYIRTPAPVAATEEVAEKAAQAQAVTAANNRVRLIAEAQGRIDAAEAQAATKAAARAAAKKAQALIDAEQESAASEARAAQIAAAQDRVDAVRGQAAAKAEVNAAKLAAKAEAAEAKAAAKTAAAEAKAQLAAEAKTKLVADAQARVDAARETRARLIAEAQARVDAAQAQAVVKTTAPKVEQVASSEALVIAQRAEATEAVKVAEALGAQAAAATTTAAAEQALTQVIVARQRNPATGRFLPRTQQLTPATPGGAGAGGGVPPSGGGRPPTGGGGGGDDGEGGDGKGKPISPIGPAKPTATIEELAVARTTEAAAALKQAEVLAQARVAETAATLAQAEVIVAEAEVTLLAAQAEKAEADATAARLAAARATATTRVVGRDRNGRPITTTRRVATAAPPPEPTTPFDELASSTKKLQEEVETYGKSRAEIALYRAEKTRLTGAETTYQQTLIRASEAQRLNTIAIKEAEAAAVKATAAEIAAAKAVEAHAVAVKAAEAAAAAKGAEAGASAVAAQISPSTLKLQEEADLLGKSRAEIALYRAEKAGLSQSEIELQQNLLKTIEDQKLAALAAKEAERAAIAATAAGVEGITALDNLHDKIVITRPSTVDQITEATRSRQFGGALAGTLEAQTEQFGLAYEDEFRRAQHSTINISTTTEKLQEEADLYGKTRAEIALYRAAKAGLDPAEIAHQQILIRTIEAQKAETIALKAGETQAKATAAATLAGRAAAPATITALQAREPFTLFREISQGNTTRAIGSLSVLAQNGGFARLAMVALEHPIVLAGAAAGVAALSFSALAYSAEKTRESVKLIEVALSATGKSALLTGTQIRQAIDDVQQLHGVNKAEATAAVDALARAPFINKAQFDQAKATIGDLAAALGVKVPEAAKVLANALENPIEGLKRLQQAHIHLTPDQEVMITALHRQGKEAEATAALLDALSSNLRGLSESGLTPLQKASRDFGNAWHNMTTSLAESGPVQSALGLLTSLLNGMASAINAVKEAQKWLDDHPGVATAARIATSISPGGGFLLASAFAPPTLTEGAPTLGGTATRPGQAFSGSPAEQGRARIAAQSAEAARAFEIEFHRVDQLTQGYETQAQKIALLVSERDVLQKGLDTRLVTLPITRREIENQIAGLNEQIGKKDDHGFRAEELRLQQELNRATEELESVTGNVNIIENKSLQTLATRLATEKDLYKIGAQRVALLVGIAEDADRKTLQTKAVTEQRTITSDTEGVQAETARLEGNVAESALDSFHKKYDLLLDNMQKRVKEFKDRGLDDLATPLQEFEQSLDRLRQVSQITDQIAQTESAATVSERANATVVKTTQVEEIAGYISHAEAVQRVIAADEAEAAVLTTKLIPETQKELANLIAIGDEGSPAADKLREKIGELDLKVLELRSHTSELNVALKGAFESSVSQALDGIIEKTETANQAVKNIEKSLEHAFVSTFTKGFVDDLATQLFKPTAGGTGPGASGPGGFLGLFPSLANFIGVTPPTSNLGVPNAVIPGVEQNQGRGGGIGNIVGSLEETGPATASAAPIAAAFSTGSATVVAALSEVFAAGAATLSEAISASLAGGAGGGGGLASLSSIASTGAAATGTDTSAAASSIPFALGGYTGSASPTTPAGIVHGQEFVHRAEVVRQPGALSFLADFNRRGMQAVASYTGGGFIKGYADGGGVQLGPASATDPKPPLTQQQFADYVNAEATAGLATQPGSGLAGSGIFHGGKDNDQKGIFGLVLALGTIAAKALGGSPISATGAQAAGTDTGTEASAIQPFGATGEDTGALADTVQPFGPDGQPNYAPSSGASTYAGTLVDNGPGVDPTLLIPGKSILPDGTVYRGTVQAGASGADPELLRQFFPGGYTGPGGKYQPAGIVHAGEFVHRQEVVKQPGAIQFLTAFNDRGMSAISSWGGRPAPGRGFAQGGVVPSLLQPAIATQGPARVPEMLDNVVTRTGVLQPAAPLGGYWDGGLVDGLVSPLASAVPPGMVAADSAYAVPSAPAAAEGYVPGYADGGLVAPSRIEPSVRLSRTGGTDQSTAPRITTRHAGQGATSAVNLVLSPEMAHTTVGDLIDRHLSDAFAKRG